MFCDCFVFLPLHFYLSLLPPPGGAAHILTVDEQGFLSYSLPPPFGGDVQGFLIINRNV